MNVIKNRIIRKSRSIVPEHRKGDCRVLYLYNNNQKKLETMALYHKQRMSKHFEGNEWGESANLCNSQKIKRQRIYTG